jgi:hypothetical protein
MLIIVIIMDWGMVGLFRPLEVHVAVFVSAVSALYSTVFWCCMLQFSFLFVRNPPFFYVHTD